MNIITRVKSKITAAHRLFDLSSRLDRLEQATFDQLDSSMTRIEELEHQLDYLKKEINRLESRVDYVEETDISDAVEEAVMELDINEYIDNDSVADAVLAEVANRIMKG